MARKPIEPPAELAAFYERFGATLSPEIRALGSALAKYLKGEAGARLVLDAEKSLASVMRDLFIESSMLGAKRTIAHADAEAKKNPPSAPRRFQRPTWETKYGQTIPKVPPTRAITDILSREPRLARTAAEVARLYSTEHVFALAKSATTVLTAKVQGVIGASLQAGLPTPAASKIIAEMGDFDKAYAATVAENGLNTAYTSGVFAQARDPSVRSEIVGLVIEGPDDSDKRENHRKALGWMADVDDPRWALLRTPLGHRCRDTVNYVMRGEAERNGWLDRSGNLIPVPIPEGAHADEGFRH